ncbi:MAG: tetratricopeptide repeat protein [Bacteroidaceae bacterium]|nr:tetratricopeptide repeat protein [Bacteroidaceae bacterium]
MESLATYISHPERLNRDTLYELRLLVGKYPYFDVARLLMLKNLYILHDIDFGREMRKSALYLKSRWPLFELMSGYGVSDVADNAPDDISVDRTMSLIDAFLDTLPAETVSLEAEGAAAVDYVSAYLKDRCSEESTDVPALRGQDLIDEFLAGGSEKIAIDFRGDNVQEPAVVDAGPQEPEESPAEASFFTETLAGIYIKQGKYEKALEIIKRLCLEYPNKNRYFADQIRFLEKIIKHIKKE